MVKRRLRFSSSPNEKMCSSSDEINQEDNAHVEGAEHDEANELGVDVATVELTLEDELKDADSDYSYEYLQECRKWLCARLEHSHCELEKALSANARQGLKHRKEIEIRHFYQTIAYAKSRSGQMVRNAMSTTAAAVAIMEEVGVQYRQLHSKPY